MRTGPDSPTLVPAPGPTSAPAAAAGRGARALAVLGSVLSVALVSLALGALTSWAQAQLSDAWHPLANSPSGWAAVTALVVIAHRPSLRWAAVLGTVGFVFLVLGYTLASELRGLTYDPTLWGTIGLAGGPFVGAAAAGAASTRTAPVALGSGLLAGVLVADGIYGLTVVAEHTSPVYWTTVLLLGILLVLTTPLVRLRAAAPSAVMSVTFLATTAVLSSGYAWLNAGLSV